MPTLPAERTLRLCRKNGWLADKVERWIPIPTHPGGGIRRDWCGIGDVLALDGKPGSHMIQACSLSTLARHQHKYEDEEKLAGAVRLWLLAGNRFSLWAWSKKGPRGQRKLWIPTVRMAVLMPGRTWAFIGDRERGAQEDGEEEGQPGPHAGLWQGVQEGPR